jgi:hypothetical protein
MLLFTRRYGFKTYQFVRTPPGSQRHYDLDAGRVSLPADASIDDLVNAERFCRDHEMPPIPSLPALVKARRI